MNITEALATIRDSAGASAEQLFRQLRTAGVTDEAAARAIATRVAASNLKAGAYGEALAGKSLHTLGTRAPRLPASSIAHAADRTRLTDAAATILGRIDPTDRSTLERAAMEVARLGSSEAVATTQQTYREGMTRSGAVNGWTRALEADACDLCEWWERDGKVWPLDHDMPTHPGCCCGQEFVTG